MKEMFEFEKEAQFTKQFGKSIKKGSTVEFEWDKSRSDMDATICTKKGEEFFKFNYSTNKWEYMGTKSW